MRKLSLIGCGLFLLFACSEAPEAGSSAKNDANTEVSDEKVKANTLLSMEVTGMTCEMGCGGTITDKLMESEGVTKVEFDFEEERATNIAIISYDDSKISDDDIETIITELNDGQFTVGSMSMEPIENITACIDNGSNGDGTVVEVSGSFIEMPNLLDMISSFFTF